jgi:hypothetical protein
MRRLPHQGARHSTVDHGDASDGVFLLIHLWVLPSSRVILPANDLPPLLSSLWMASRVNGSLSCEWRRLQQLRVEGSSGATKGRPNRPSEWARLAGLGWPTRAHPGPVQSPLHSRGSSCIYALCPLHLHHFDDVILASKMEVLLAWSPVFTLQSSGMFLCNTSVLATFGSDFIKLLNTNETPKLLLWTCCDFILYVHDFLQKHNTSKCTHKYEIVIWLVCLVAG